jgi:hypothetical protein
MTRRRKKAKKRAKAGTYYQKNKARIKAARRAYYRRNKKKIIAKVRAYAKANRVKIRERNRKKRAEDPERWKEYHRSQYRKHKKKRLKAIHAYHWKNRDTILLQMRARYHAIKDSDENKEYRRRYYEENKEHIYAYQKEYSRKHPDRIKNRTKRYRAKNLERLRAYDRWRSKNASPKRKKSAARWRERNPEKLKSYRTKIFIRARTLLGNRCAICKWNDFPDILEIDHKIPLATLGIKRSRPGSSSAYEAVKNPEKFQLLCPNCHAIKTSLEKRMRNPHETKSKAEYRLRRERLVERFGGFCLVCGYDKNPLAFEFDHIEPIWGSKRSPAIHHATKAPELFQMLCANCHTLKTRMDFEKKRKIR